MIQKVGFKNFRRFKNFPEMELGDINIFVGRNNAGKSTVLKALQLMKGNLNTLSSISSRHDIRDLKSPMFVFDVDELAELHIDNFERALYNKAERKEITLSATIEGCSFTIVLDGQNIEQNSYYVAVPYNYIELKDEIIHLTFNFQTRHLLVELKRNNNLVNVDIIDKLKEEQKNTKFLIAHLEAEKRDTNAAVHVTEIQQTMTSEEMIEMVSRRQNIEKLLRSYYKQLEQIENNIDLLEKDREEEAKRVTTIDINSLPEFPGFEYNNIISRIFGNLINYAEEDFNLDMRTNVSKKVTRNQQLIKNSKRELREAHNHFLYALSIFDLEYIHAHAASQKVIYLKEDNKDVLSHAISEFCKARILPGDEEWTFIKKWMSKDRFGIGDDFSIKDIQSAGYMLKIIEDGEDMDLADKGTGSIQIMTLLFSLAVIMHKAISNDRYVPTVLIEEPEQNIHPMLQSMLADMFVDFWKLLSKGNKSQLIVETHSEYLIRRTQVLVAEESYVDEQEMLEDNLFRVFYFEKENLDQPFYQMTYGINGRFKESFGRGFYDAAGNLALELSNREITEEKNEIDWSAL